MDGLLEAAKQFLKDQNWNPELILNLGAHLAQAVNRVEGLSGAEKCDLVCRTILQLLDDAEKADEERKKESTDPDCSSPGWGELRSVVKNLLPTTLTLIVKAARGKFDLKSAKELIGSAVEAAGGAASLAQGAASLVQEASGKNSWLTSCFGFLAAVLPPAASTQPQPAVAEPPKESENRPAAEAAPGSADPASTS